MAGKAAGRPSRRLPPGAAVSTRPDAVYWQFLVRAGPRRYESW